MKILLITLVTVLFLNVANARHGTIVSTIDNDIVVVNVRTDINQTVEVGICQYNEAISTITCNALELLNFDNSSSGNVIVDVALEFSSTSDGWLYFNVNKNEIQYKNLSDISVNNSNKSPQCFYYKSSKVIYCNELSIMNKYGQIISVYFSNVRLYLLESGQFKIKIAY